MQTTVLSFLRQRFAQFQSFCTNAFENLKSQRRQSSLLTFSGVLLLFVLVFTVYRPVLPGTFLMDDWRLIDSDNPLVNGKQTLSNIWFETDFTLSTLVLWLERQEWGNSPAWYHFLNILLHGTSAVLLWRVLRALKISNAWFAGALYAVHPVCVNSVARIAEIKNTLSLPFFLLSFLAYLYYERLILYPAASNPGNQKSKRSVGTLWYLLALTAFLLALLAKTSTVMLPVLLLACAAWQRRKVTQRDWLHVAPFLVLSLAFGLMSIWFQKHQALFTSGETLQPESFGQRIAIAGHVILFYLGKAFVPLHLNLVYPQWIPDPASILSYFPFFILALLVLICWRQRQTWGRHALFGLGCFVIALFPVLGLFDSQFLTRWQVSDHLQYLALVAAVAMAAAAFVVTRSLVVSRVCLVGLVVLTAFLAFERASVFVTEEKLLTDCISKNPQAAVAQNDLGVILAKRKDFAAAMTHFEAALESNPGNADAQMNMGHLLGLANRLPEAEQHLAIAMPLKPSDAEIHKNYADILLHEGKLNDAICHYRIAIALKPDVQAKIALAALYYRIGDAHSCVAEYRHIIEANPNSADALGNLAWVLATCGDETVRNGTEAVYYAERACHLTGYTNARITGTLAAAYAEAKRYPDAVAAGQTTVKLARDAGDKHIFDVGNQLLILYHENQPYHEPLANN